MSSNMRSRVLGYFCCLIIIAILAISIISLKELLAIKSGSSEDVRQFQVNSMSHLYYSISDDSTILDNNLIQNYLLNNDLINSPVLVVCYSQFSCNSCLDYLLSKLRECFPDYETNKQILFVATDFKSDPYKTLGNTVTIRDSDELGLASTASNEPFLFIDIDGYVFHVFTPDSRYDFLFETYLSTIKDKYFLD